MTEGMINMKTYDLILFAGQSNMAGRGISTEKWNEPAPLLLDGAGMEYRAVSDQEHIHKIEEPFGVNENNPNGIYEPGMKTGSMVTAFVNAYYKETKVPVLAVSASKGGSAICEWQGNEDYLSDAIERLEKAVLYAKKNQIEIRHKYVAWCQGETDGDRGTLADDYKKKFKNMLERLRKAGIEKCFLVTIGEYNGKDGYEEAYRKIRHTQLELAEKVEDIILICDEFHTMKARELMKDSYHYFQTAYNEVGKVAGENAGRISTQDSRFFKQK